ncbi:MAG: ferrochelatase [Flavobacteriales bacterium]
MKKKAAIILVNLGSPDHPTPGAVYRYLTEFLNDRRVIDVAWLGRKILVNGIIVPFRHRKSAKVYQSIWTDEGSPLIAHSKHLREKLEASMQHERFDVRCFLAMRYQNPSMLSAIREALAWNPDEVILLPLFPQYASATTGSVADKFMRILRDAWVIPSFQIIEQFWDNPSYLDAVAARAVDLDVRSFDHVLFSYHGLPERQVDKIYDDRKCKNHACEHEVNEENKWCYKAACYGTSREVAARLGLKEDQYTVCFQSRLGKGWIEPFADQLIERMAKEGKKRLLVFSPAFVADCLETIEEIGGEYQELFEHHGGEKVQLVPSLNSGPDWVETLRQMCLSRLNHL